MSVIKIIGLASKTTTDLRPLNHEYSENLLKWLRKNAITIASSCDGEGVCKKCTIQNDWLTCKLTLEEFFERQPDGKIFITYL